MFSGIVEECGAIHSLQESAEGLKLTIAAKEVLKDIQRGASIAVNGVCLTVVDFSKTHFSVEVVAETLRRSNLGQLKLASPVNLERSLKMSDRIGGHFVQGHVDATMQLIKLVPEGEALLATFSITPEWSRYLVPKGYVALDGMSITVIDVSNTEFSVTFIPHTQTATTVQYYKPGCCINLEVDILSKTLDRLMRSRGVSSNV